MKTRNIISVNPNSTVFGDQGSWVNEHLLEVLINRGMFSSALERYRQRGKGVMSIPVHISIRLFGISVSGAHMLITPYGLVCKFDDQALGESYSFDVSGEARKLWKSVCHIG